MSCKRLWITAKPMFFVFGRFHSDNSAGARVPRVGAGMKPFRMKPGPCREKQAPERREKQAKKIPEWEAQKEEGSQREKTLPGVQQKKSAVTV